MNKRFEKAAEEYGSKDAQTVFGKMLYDSKLYEVFLAGAKLGYAEGRREMNEECAQLACAYSITGLDGLTEEIRALVADEEKSTDE